MAFSGLLALLDDITALTDDIATLADDVVALSDDVATLTVTATKKTTGLVTDDMAVTAEQTIGLAGDREIPVVVKVARGSLFNKFVLLCPGALFLDWIAPWTIGPILMAGGLFLSFEGVEKILHKTLHKDDHDDHGGVPALAKTDPVAYETMRVSGAIRTDLILSAEIVALTLATVADAELVTKIGVLYAVSLIITVGVYGLVAGLVKLDDLGVAMVARGGGAKSLGRLILKGTPWLMRGISWIGTIAMLLVGGHILVHGIPPLEHAIHDLVHHAPAALQGALATVADFLTGTVAGLLTVGVAQTLLSTSPLFVLPIVLLLGEHVSRRAAIGAVISIIGVALLFIFAD